MGLFSNLRNKSDESEPWLTNLMDDESVPLDDMLATSPPPPADESAKEPVDAWHFPDLEPETEKPELSLDATPFADDAPHDFDDTMLDLGPIGHEPNAFATAKPFGDLAEFAESPMAMPAVFDRRTDEPVSIDVDDSDLDSVAEPLYSLTERHVGPVGSEAVAMLDAFGLAEGATWIELRERYVEMATNCRTGEDATLAMETELAVLRREINSLYSSLRLLAAP